MKTRIIALTLVALALVTMSACSQNSPSPSPSPSSGAATPTPTSTPTPSRDNQAPATLEAEPADLFVYEFARAYEGGRLYDGGNGIWVDKNSRRITEFSEGLILTKYLGEKTQLRVPDEIEGFPIIGIAAKCFEVGVVTDVGYPNTLLFFEFGNPDYQDILSLNLSGELIIPHGVTKIVNIRGWSRESAVANVTNVRLPDTLREIGMNAFQAFVSLTSVVIPDGVHTIASSAFWDCKSLLRVEIPDSVVYTDRNAFVNTSWFDTLPDGMIYIGKAAFGWKGEMPPNTHITLHSNCRSSIFV